MTTYVLGSTACLDEISVSCADKNINMKAAKDITTNFLIGFMKMYLLILLAPICLVGFFIREDILLS